jgi:hypothetical protein
MRIKKIDFEEGKKHYENREEINPGVCSEIREKIPTPINRKDILDELTIHDNFLCGKGVFVYFMGNLLKKIFKSGGEFYFLVEDDRTLNKIFIKLEDDDTI